MTISNSLICSLQNVFDFNVSFNPLSYAENTGNYIIAKAISTGNFVPSICFPVITPYLADIVHRDIVMPLLPPTHDIKKTSDSIIGALFRRVGWGLNSYRRCFKYIDTTKGYGYYGGKGLILTDDYKPLLVCGYETISTVTRFEYENPVCLVSPEVFTRDDIVSKCIVKKIIPYYSTAKIHHYVDNNGRTCCNDRVKIVISPEINGLIHRTVEPLGTDVDDALYNILASSMTTLQTL